MSDYQLNKTHRIARSIQARHELDLNKDLHFVDHQAHDVFGHDVFEGFPNDTHVAVHIGSDNLHLTFQLRVFEQT